MIKCGNEACSYNKKGVCSKDNIELKYGNANIPKGKEFIVDDKSDIDRYGCLEYLICKDYKW